MKQNRQLCDSIAETLTPPRMFSHHPGTRWVKQADVPRGRNGFGAPPRRIRSLGSFQGKMLTSASGASIPYSIAMA
jgi:hypothetical protein